MNHNWDRTQKEKKKNQPNNKRHLQKQKFVHNIWIQFDQKSKGLTTDFVVYKPRAK